MRLVELLESLGDKLGILEKAEGNAAHPASKIRTRSITLQDLTSEIRSEAVQALADLPAELSVPFDKIIEAAGITSGPHGWDIERLKRLLQTEEFKKLSREDTQKRILAVLGAQGVGTEELVKDAVSRDCAMDAFEKTARAKMQERLATRERQNAEVTAKINELEKEATRLREQIAADQARWREWRSKKRERERDLAWTVGFLIDHQVITTDDTDD